MTNSSPWYRWPIEIDGLAINSMVIFHGYVSHNQRVDPENGELFSKPTIYWFNIGLYHTEIWIIFQPGLCQFFGMVNHRRFSEMGLSDNGGYRSHKIAVSLGKDDDKTITCWKNQYETVDEFGSSLFSDNSYDFKSPNLGVADIFRLSEYDSYDYESIASSHFWGTEYPGTIGLFWGSPWYTWVLIPFAPGIMKNDRKRIRHSGLHQHHVHIYVDIYTYDNIYIYIYIYIYTES